MGKPDDVNKVSKFRGNSDFKPEIGEKVRGKRVLLLLLHKSRIYGL